ncbi:MAG: radical SAM protein, partial [Halobacteria archaeon]|nr:radical SAM protein [Halobacteria archaeon]
CRAEAQPERHPDELTTGEAKDLLDEAREFGENQLVVLSGGDPLKRDDVFELVEVGDGIGLNVTMTPSGTTSLDTESVERLAESGLRRVALSVDGVGRSHDEFRGEEGSYEETLRAAEDAVESGLPLQINTTVCGYTVDDLPEIRDLVEELGAVLWSVFFLVPVGRGATLEQITPERAEEVMEWLSDVAEESSFGVKTTEAPQYRRVKLQSEGSVGGRRSTGIRAGDGFAFVSHTGELFPSGFLPVSAGNVKDESLVDLYRNSDLFERLRKPETYDGKCGACEFRNVCGGSRSRAYASTGDPFGSDPLCAYVPDGYDGPLPWDNP